VTIGDLHIDKVLSAADKRPRKYPWCGIIIHHTGIGDRTSINDQSIWQKLFTSMGEWLTKKDDNELSAHYLVGRDGELAQLVDPDHYVAYHAGVSLYWNPALRKVVQGCNDYFIGIEIVNDGNLLSYSDAQYKRVAEVCSYLLKKFPDIQPNMIIGHEMVAPGRKFDPGKYFDWKNLYSRIFT
jgi:N-acetyl-anhydromuramyl-L-alanine amidase AmpD